MDLNLTNTGYVMVSRALLMSVSQKHHIASGDEEAFLRVLLHVNYKNKVLKHNGAEVTCARGESVISYLAGPISLAGRADTPASFLSVALPTGFWSRCPVAA